MLWEPLFGCVPCCNYIGSCGYKSSSRKEKSTEKKRAGEMKTQEMCKGISGFTVSSLFALPLALSTCLIYHWIVLSCSSPRPSSNKICSSTALNFPKYSCYATKSEKTSSRVPKMYRDQSFYSVEGARLSSFTNFLQWNEPHAYTHTDTRAHLSPTFFMNGLVVRDWLRQHIKRKRNLHSWFGLTESCAQRSLYRDVFLYHFTVFFFNRFLFFCCFAVSLFLFPVYFFFHFFALFLSLVFLLFFFLSLFFIFSWEVSKKN